jgi:hypothetical protein
MDTRLEQLLRSNAGCLHTHYPSRDLKLKRTVGSGCRMRRGDATLNRAGQTPKTVSILCTRRACATD